MRLIGFSVLFLLFFLSFVNASLGISPAKHVLDFVPGQVHKFNYFVSSDNPNGLIEIYFDGDLAKYATSNVKNLTGSGGFEVILSLPQSIEIPGEHSLYVRAIESVGEGEFLGGRVDIGSLVRILVPYPGEFAFLSMDLPDGNVGESFKINFKVENKGTDVLLIDTAFIELFNSGKLVETLNFEPINVEPTKSYTYETSLDSKDFLPGEYLASAVIKSPNTWSINDTFRLGSQFLNITYFTTNVSSGDIHPFYVNVQSLWNNDIRGVFADINLTNSSGGVESSFRTPSFDFLAWEQKVISGFIDARELKGEYNALVEINYGGKKTSATGLFFVTETSYALIIIISLSVLLIGFIIYKLMKRKK